ncbi:proline-rich protein 20G [Camelus ferus]|uniref:Proline-rich protein 20G n=1 Tax=Camelus ferus TaxID=419612 RepID=A0A8B8RBH6_CAMFR|nr:proline-rich protein 20G [Camelus ferus]
MDSHVVSGGHLWAPDLSGSSPWKGLLEAAPKLQAPRAGCRDVNSGDTRFRMEERPSKRFCATAPGHGGRPWQEGRPDAEDGAPVGAASPALPGRAPKPFAYVKPMRRETSTSVEPARPAQRGRGRHRGNSQRTGRGGGRGTGPHPHVELDNRDEPGHPVEPEARRTPSLPFTQAAGQGYRLQGPGPLGDLLGVRHQGLPNAYGYWDLQGSRPSAICPYVGFVPSGSALIVMQMPFGTYLYAVPPRSAPYYLPPSL